MTEDELASLRDQANELLERGDFENAVALYQMAVDTSTGETRARVQALLAMCLAQVCDSVSGPGSRTVAENAYSRIERPVPDVVKEAPAVLACPDVRGWRVDASSLRLRRTPWTHGRTRFLWGWGIRLCQAIRRQLPAPGK